GFKLRRIGAGIRRYDLTDFEWSVIEPVLPMDRRGPKPRDNRRVLNGIFWVLRTGAPWRDLPERYGPYTSAYNRFNRWRKAGIWDGMMDAIVKAYDGNVQMIDNSIVRVHQHASGPKKEWRSLCEPKPRRHHHKNPRARRRERPPGLPPDLAGLLGCAYRGPRDKRLPESFGAHFIRHRVHRAASPRPRMLARDGRRMSDHCCATFEPSISVEGGHPY